ncbi:hypothetical protein MNBD_ALPHA04-2164, partial [hydrothermal vent metagenome]
FLDSVATTGFMSIARREQLIVSNDIDEAIGLLKSACTGVEGKITW